jgi:hypothetical protein
MVERRLQNEAALLLSIFGKCDGKTGMDKQTCGL